MPTCNTPAAATTTATISPVCRKCGRIKKSGKSSCCGRGGSWFRKCGGAVNTKLHHTWYEGIQTCKTRSQSKSVIAQYLNATQGKGIVGSSSDGVDMRNFKSVFTVTKSFTFTSSDKTTSHDPAHTSVSIPMITPGCERLFNFTLFYISVLLIIVT